MRPSRTAPSLSPEIAYYRRLLLAGRFRMVAVGDLAVVPPEDARLVLPKAALLRAPESPAWRDTLLASREPFVSAGFVSDRGRRPVLVLKGHGAWVLHPPSRGRTFERLRELDRPERLLPVRFTRLERDGVARHLHSIPLRWHPHGHLSLELRIFAGGSVSYDAWVWLPAHRQIIPLYWAEKERVVQLFRDLTASYFRCAPPATPAVDEDPHEDLAHAPAVATAS